MVKSRLQLDPKPSTATPATTVAKPPFTPSKTSAASNAPVTPRKAAEGTAWTPSLKTPETPHETPCGTALAKHIGPNPTRLFTTTHAKSRCWTPPPKKTQKLLADLTSGSGI